MRLLHRLSNNRGDTIVEVLIALMIISLILVGAYNVSNRSTREVRTSQEHSTLLLLLQGQIEQVRALAREATDVEHSHVYSVSPKYFCIDTTTGQRADFDASVTSLPSSDHLDTTGYNDACKNIDGLYAIAISYDPIKNIFTFTGNWDTLGGSKGEEQLNYKVYPGGSTDVINPTASLSGTVCARDPVTHACLPSPPGPPQYHWGTAFENQSTNPGLEVVGCKWDFGDGSPPLINRHCNYGDLAGHVYTPPSVVPPYPALCYDPPYPDTVVTLTMYFEGGFSATNTTTKHVPVCY